MHVDSTGGFPYGWEARGFGWTYPLLPYIEQQALFDSINTEYNAASDPASDTPNRLACATLLAIMRCGSMNQQSHVAGLSAGGIRGRVPGSYGACASSLATADLGHDAAARPQYRPGTIGLRNNSGPPANNQHNGIFWGGSSVRFSEISDGLSRTIALGERFTDIDFLRDGNTTDYWYIQSPQIRSGNLYAVEQAGRRGGVPASVGSMNAGANEFTEFVGTTNSPLNAALDPSTTGYYAEIGFGSWHATGAQFAFADGSVRLLTSDIDPGVYRPMGSRRPPKWPWEVSAHPPEERGFSR